MKPHFRAFSFVDRIHEVEPGARIRGAYAIPGHVDDFPTSLVAEAVGQLAAWSAMAAVDFKFRPVAGIAGAIDLLAPVRPGDSLELSAHLDAVDTGAVSYGGMAAVDGVTVVRLENCVGPMVPVEEYDDPQAVRERFTILCGKGATPGGFGGLPELPIERTAGETGQWTRATFRIPTGGAFFEDHFPRRPVFPGSLLMQTKLRLAATLAAELDLPGTRARWKPASISDVKLRAFIPPGEQIDVEVKAIEHSNGTVHMTVESRNGRRLIGGARVRLVREELS